MTDRRYRFAWWWGMAVLLTVSPALAVTKNCNATLVSQNICSSNVDRAAVCHDFSTLDPDGAGPLLAVSTKIEEAFALKYGWVATPVCTDILIKQKRCTSGQLGQPFSETKAKFADAMIRWFVVNDVLRWYDEATAHAAAQTQVDTAPDPDVGGN